MEGVHQFVAWPPYREAPAISVEADSVIWDMDGTFINSMTVLMTALGVAVAKHELLLPPREIFAKNFHGSLRDSVNAAFGGLEDALLDEILEDFQTAQNDHYDDVDPHFYPDAVALAGRAHDAGKFQMVVTNRNHIGSDKASPRSIMERSSVAAMMQHVICGDDSEHRKPEPRVLGSLILEGAVVPERTVVIGDQFVDAQFARNIGARAILVCREDIHPAHMDQLDKDWPDYVTIVPTLDLVALA